MPYLADGKPKTLVSKVAHVPAPIIAGCICLVILFAVTPLIQSISSKAGEQTGQETNPPVPVVTSKSGWHDGSVFTVRFTVHNKGGPGIVLVGALARYEKFSGYGNSVFEKSGSIFLNSNETCEIVYVFTQILAVPCGNRHTIVWAAWARVP